MMWDRPQIEIKKLSFTYPRTFSGRSAMALKDISLDFSAGEIVLIEGPSGSGKSTLCRCINGLIPHTTRGRMTGEVVIEGINTKDLEVGEIASRVGTVFQDPDHQIFSNDTDSELAFGPEQRGWPEEKIESAIIDITGRFGISHLRGRAVNELSWGERQRLAIASVAIISPQILVLDEPFSGVDHEAATDLIRTLRTLNRDTGMTIIIAEHRTGIVLPLATRVVVLSEGKIVRDEKMGERQSTGDFPRVAPEVNVSPGMERSHAAGVQEGEIRPIIHLEDLWYRYPGSGSHALEAVTLDIFPGEITVLMGSNGSGKTTLIKHLNGLIRPDRGRILVRSQDISQLSVAGIAREIGVVQQHADFQLFEETIGGEIAFGPRNFGIPEDEINEKVKISVDLLQIGHLGLTTPPLSLSVGEKQRVVLAGLLAMDPQVMVLDEPTIGLDISIKEKIARVLIAKRDEGKAIVIATHDAEFTSLCADRIVTLSAGRIVSDCRPLKNSSG